ncbi:hypothetical protein OROGR_002486 [Orobanche gracilis]
MFFFLSLRSTPHGRSSSPHLFAYPHTHTRTRRMTDESQKQQRWCVTAAAKVRFRVISFGFRLGFTILETGRIPLAAIRRQLTVRYKTLIRILEENTRGWVLYYTSVVERVVKRLVEQNFLRLPTPAAALVQQWT